MDGLNIALNLAYNCSSFEEAIKKAVSWGGDSDTIAAIAGQILGAIYGLNENVMKLYFDKMECLDYHSVFVKAYKLFHKKAINTSYKYKK